MFLNVSTGFPGSMHGSRVWGGKHNVKPNVTEKTKVGPVLLGDGGYPLK